ncbi:MAG TPA: VTT domain-containing protein [Gammaproteobacteria bacterium]
MVLIALLAGIVLALLYREHLDASALEQWVHDAGAAGPLIFMATYALATVLFLPGSVLTLAGGALFGPVLGTVYNLTGATLGALLAFLVARYLASEWVEQKTGGRLKQLKQGVEEEGWRFVAFVRLVPLFPFNVLNYALGLTRIKVWHYVIASYICMLPGAVAYTYLGYAGREAVAGSEGLMQKALIALALLATVAFLPRLIKQLRRAPMLTVADLKQKLGHGDHVLVLDVRTAEEFTGEWGHIPQASNIPVEDLAHRVEELAGYRQHPIAIVCRADKRSLKAAQLLTQKGFADVHVVKGGMTEWSRLEYGVER